MKKIIPIALVIVALSTALFMSLRNSGNDIYALYDLEGKTVNEMVEHLESITVNPNILMAGINGTHLMLTTSDGTEELEVKGDVFYLSFAPYINQTHPCGTHNLTTCRGEMQRETFDVLIETDDGEILFEGELTTEKNGFAGLWLPRDKEATITVTYGALSASDSIATFADSHTCLTTLKLEENN